jgi:NADPH-dependent 2,4-dienoyl-CoA reductase/sulfur reductase-like enzyme
MNELGMKKTREPLRLREAREQHVPWKGATGHVQDVWKSGTIEKAWGSRPGPIGLLAAAVASLAGIEVYVLDRVETGLNNR